MKKALAIILALVAVSAFAQEYSFTGDASVTWGLNLNTNMHGFNNASNFELTIPMVSGSESKGGEGTYGMISATGFNLDIIDGAFDWTDATMAAKIISGPLYVGIFGAPSLKYTNAQQIAPFAASSYTATSAVIPSVATKGGVTLGYDSDMFDVSFKLASKGDWGVTAATAAGAATIVYGPADAAYTEAEAIAAGLIDPTDGAVWAGGDGPVAAGQLVGTVTAGAAAVPASASDQYAFGLDVVVTPLDIVTITAGMFYDIQTKYLGLTGKVAATPIENLSLTLALDALKIDTADLKLDVYGKVAYSFLEAKDSVAFETYFTPLTATTNRLDIGFKFTDAEGFVPGFGTTLAAYAYDLLASPANDPMKVSVAESLWYKAMLDDVNYVKPYQKAYYDLVGEDLYFNFGVEAVLIPNTTFTLDYAAGTPAKNDNINIAGAVNAFAEDKGILKFTTKISF